MKNAIQMMESKMSPEMVKKSSQTSRARNSCNTAFSTPRGTKY